MTQIISNGRALFADRTGFLDDGQNVTIEKIKISLRDNKLGYYAVCGSFLTCSAIDAIMTSNCGYPAYIEASNFLKDNPEDLPDIIGFHYGQKYVFDDKCCLSLITKLGQLVEVDNTKPKQLVIGSFSTEFVAGWRGDDHHDLEKYAKGIGDTLCAISTRQTNLDPVELSAVRFDEIKECVRFFTDDDVLTIRDLYSENYYTSIIKKITV